MSHTDDEHAALHRVARAVAASMAPEALFDLVAEEVAGLFDVAAGIVWRFEGHVSVAVGSWGDHLTIVGKRFPLRGDGAVPRAWATDRPSRTHYGAIAEDDPTRSRVEDQGYVWGIAAPVRTAGRTWGAVLAATTGPEPFPGGAEDRLGNFADLVGLAIGNIEDREALAARASEQEAVGRVATAVATGRSPDEVCELVCREAALLTGAVVGGVTRLTSDGEGVVVVAWTDGAIPALVPGTVIPVPVDVLAAMDASGRATHRTPVDATRTGWRADWGDAVTATISIAGATWGILSVAAARGTRLPETTERRLASLANLAGIAVANAENRRDITRRTSEQGALRRVAMAVDADAAPEAVFALVCREAAQLFDGAMGTVLEIEARDAPATRAVWHRDDLPGPPTDVRIALEETPGGMLHAGSTAPISPDTEQVGEWRASYGESVVAPIELHGRLWGLLSVTPEAGSALAPDADGHLLSFSRDRRRRARQRRDARGGGRRGRRAGRPAPRRDRGGRRGRPRRGLRAHLPRGGGAAAGAVGRGDAPTRRGAGPDRRELDGRRPARADDRLRRGSREAARRGRGARRGARGPLRPRRGVGRVGSRLLRRRGRADRDRR